MEWLSTGEMIEKLKVGEIAELFETHQVKYVTSFDAVYKKEDGSVCWCRKEGHVKSNFSIVMDRNAVNFKWHILPRFVSFGEAMEHFGPNTTLRSWVPEESESIPYNVHKYRKNDLGDMELRLRDEEITNFHGMKWTIEEDSQ